MTLSEILSAFRQRRLNIDCVEITLVQNSETGAISFRGPGYIRQGEDDQLGFKIYAVETANTDPFRDLSGIDEAEYVPRENGLPPMRRPGLWEAIFCSSERGAAVSGGIPAPLNPTRFGG